MVVFRKFKAIRPNPKLVQDVACLPYDVLSSSEARELAAGNPYSFLHIDKAEVDLPETVDVHSSEVYEKAAENLETFLEEEWLVKDEQAEFYLYELTMNGRSQTGIVGTTAIDDYSSGKIKRHEYTLPAKEQDRIRHFDATNSNSSPIFLTYHAEAEIQSLIADWKAEHTAIYDFISYYDVQHKVWAIDDASVADKLTALFKEVPALYIADGHHRSASSVAVGKKRREELGSNPEAAYNYFLSVVFPDNELEILDYNRVVTTPLPENFWDKVAESFEIEEIEKSAPAQPHDIHAYTAEKGWLKLTAKPEQIPDDEVERLDVAILQARVLAPLLAIQDPKTSPNIAFVGGIRGLDALEKGVAEGGTIAFAMYPPSLAELLAVADAGKIMPAKSTWFEPKLLSGLFLHDLKD